MHNTTCKNLEHQATARHIPKHSTTCFTITCHGTARHCMAKHRMTQHCKPKALHSFTPRETQQNSAMCTAQPYVCTQPCACIHTYLERPHAEPLTRQGHALTAPSRSQSKRITNSKACRLSKKRHTNKSFMTAMSSGKGNGRTRRCIHSCILYVFLKLATKDDAI